MVVDCSIVRPAFYRYIVIPLYDRICKDSRIHPNAITLIGLFIVVCVLLSTIWNPHNHIVNLLASASILFYAVADHFDGMHARKTHRCSDFGEFLDHFCDYLSRFFLMLLIYIINNFVY
jgi:phosphatidylglycerophosphate synthase